MLKISKIICASLLLLVFSCDDIPNDVVEALETDIVVTKVTPPGNVIYSDETTSFTIGIEFENAEDVSEVYCRVSFYDASFTLYDNIQLLDDGDSDNNGDYVAGDSKFAARETISDENPSGNYQIDFYVKPNSLAFYKAASTHFYFDNQQDNIPPVISNLTMPDSVLRGVDFQITMKAVDQNGQRDLKRVFFQLYRPDGTVVYDTRPDPDIDYWLMADNGDADSVDVIYGDVAAGDSVYSFKNSFGESSATGLWKFIFKAEDRGGKKSDEIEHNLEVL